MDQEHPIIVHTPPQILNEARTLYGNKAILTFKTCMSIDKVLEQIIAFNEEHATQLILHNELRYSLFVVQFDLHLSPHGKQDLLDIKYIKALEIYATFNDYHANFDASNLLKSKHLIIVHIPNDNLEIFRLITFIVAHIGRYVRGKIATGNENHFISMLMETKQ